MCRDKMKEHKYKTIMMSENQFNMPINTKQKGMTLIELLFVLAIAGIILGIAIPSMKSIIDNQRLSAANNDLISSLIFARSEAVRQKKHITVCASSNESTCNTGGTGISNWSEGWIVFANTSSNDLTRSVATESLLRVISVSRGISSITLTVNSGTPSLLSYRPNGSIGNVAISQAKLFTICDDRGSSAAHSTLLNRTGRPKAHKTGFSDAALSCEL